ncbi:MAG TPA: GDP-mannose 4,6-dehydratase [Longimicrobium sp.]|nr:GDP-mannose 4,6-dehydratase [Longimicrobium sp.]
MRVLVTGAAGFAGCHLAQALLAEGHEVWGTLQSGHAPPREPAGVRWAAMELTSADSIARAMGETRPERVFHLAAQASVANSFDDPEATWEVNATGTLRLVSALPEGARMLFISSSEVYGVVPDAGQPIREAAPPRPGNPYAASKAAAEMAVLEAALGHANAHAVIARSFSHTGPGQDNRFALAAFARQLARIAAGLDAPVLRVGNLEARRDYLDVRDVVRAYLLLMERGVPGEIYNVASGEPYRLGELLEMLIELSGTGARVEVDPARVRPVDVPLLSGNSSALRALGWAPEIPLRQTLADLLRHEQAALPAAAEAV